MHKLQPEKLPCHMAVIMDGNGRWAKERMLRRIVGHQKGVETVRSIVEECSRLGIRYLTLFAFSSENWLRPKTEVRALMALLKRYVKTEISRMMQNNIRFNVIGNRGDLPPDVNLEVDNAIAGTCRKYRHDPDPGPFLRRTTGDHQCRDPAGRGHVHREKSPRTRWMKPFLTVISIPSACLIRTCSSRTSGEMRISNFLLWQLAYTELYFTDVNWPDFDLGELHKSLRDFQARERRFGRTSDQLNKRN